MESGGSNLGLYIWLHVLNKVCHCTTPVTVFIMACAICHVNLFTDIGSSNLYSNPEELIISCILRPREIRQLTSRSGKTGNYFVYLQSSCFNHQGFLFSIALFSFKPWVSYYSDEFSTVLTHAYSFRFCQVSILLLLLPSVFQNVLVLWIKYMLIPPQIWDYVWSF